MIPPSPDSTRPPWSTPATRYRRRAGLISYVAPVLEWMTVGATRPVPIRRSPERNTRLHAQSRHHECRGASRQLDAPDAPPDGSREPPLLRHQRLPLLPRHRRDRRRRPLRDLRLPPPALLATRPTTSGSAAGAHRLQPESNLLRPAPRVGRRDSRRARPVGGSPVPRRIIRS